MIIYLISSYINGETSYKIGITKNNISKRLKQLQTGNPSLLEVIHTFESKYASKIESNFHRLLENKNIKGEWYNLNYNDINTFLDRCKLCHNNFEFLSKNNTWIIDKKLL